MVPLKLKIEESFFQPEERNGYLVDSEMKKVWAVELDLLNEFSRVCKNYGLQWFAHAGTLLGAVRHHGFIPWDDDIDVMMPRKDYERFCAIAPAAFSYPYFFQSEETDPFYCRYFTRLRNSQTTGIIVSEKQFHFPYNQGIFIDIFPYDNLPDDETELSLMKDRLLYLENLGWQFRNMVHFYIPKKDKGVIKRLNYFIKHLLYRYLLHSVGDYHRFLEEHHSLVTSYDGKEVKRVGEMIIPPLDRHVWKKEWLESTVLMPFEMIQIPVPAAFEDVLSASFGENWRIPIIANTMHGTMQFDTEKSYTDYL